MCLLLVGGQGKVKSRGRSLKLNIKLQLELITEGNITLQSFITSSTMEVQPSIDTSVSISQFFLNNPSLKRGLELIGVKNPTYLQSSLFASQSTLQHLTLIAPQGSGKVLGVLLYALRKILQSQSSILLILVPSKELSIKCSTLINQLARIQSTNLWINNGEVDQESSIIIGSPAQAQNLTKQIKDSVSHSIIIEFDMLIWMGYEQHLKRLFDCLITPKIYLTSNSDCPQLQEFKKTYMKKVLNMEIEAEEQNDKLEKEEGIINHFFYVGEKYGMYSALYITLKFGMTQPKTLILCKDLREVYRTYLFLERCLIRNVGLYNPENPLDVKFYALSLWLSGHTNILIASPQLFQDINSNIFKPHCLKTYKRSTIEMRSLSSIIVMGLDSLQDYSPLFSYFNNKALVITLSDRSQVEQLNSLFEYEKKNYSNVKLKNFPITNLEVEGFVYRVKDLVNHLGNKRVDWFMQIDLKKKLIKSKDLAEYFQSKQEEKQLLLKQIHDLTQKLNYGRVELTSEVPPYLVPQILKQNYTKKIEQQLKQDFKKPVESISQKIRKVVANIDDEEQNPDITDVNRLKIISNRKRWKLKHGFKLKRRNIKNEKRGIFLT